MSVHPARYRFTVDEYQRMGEAGVLGPDDRVELIDGEIVTMAPIGSRHAACVGRLSRILFELVGDRAIVWVQNPVRLGTYSEPQPDVALLRSRSDFYEAGLPRPEDTLIVVEVAETSLDYDLGLKARLYGRSGIPTVWVVDIDGRAVHELSGPGPDGYRTTGRAESGDRLAIADLGEDVVVAVSDVLPG
jgi:Uma2 family endonuclease